MCCNVCVAMLDRPLKTLVVYRDGFCIAVHSAQSGSDIRKIN